MLVMVSEIDEEGRGGAVEKRSAALRQPAVQHYNNNSRPI